jgi:hypothetical protein
MTFSEKDGHAQPKKLKNIGLFILGKIQYNKKAPDRLNDRGNYLCFNFYKVVDPLR